jgi:hypothetical protein
MTNAQLGPKASFADIRLFLVIGTFGAIITFLLPVYYLHLILSDCDASGRIRRRSVKVGKLSSEQHGKQKPASRLGRVSSGPMISYHGLHGSE